MWLLVAVKKYLIKTQFNYFTIILLFNTIMNTNLKPQIVKNVTSR